MRERLFRIKKTPVDFKSDGFTLVEVLVAVFILGVALTATSYLIIVNIQNANAIRNNIIASGLLQEGVEIVRNIRDRDWHLGNSFGASVPDGTWRNQWDSLSLLPGLGFDFPLKRDPASGLYGYDTGTDTFFHRTLEIYTIVPGVEKRVDVTVSWVERGGVTKSLRAETHLYNWR